MRIDSKTTLEHPSPEQGRLASASIRVEAGRTTRSASTTRIGRQALFMNPPRGMRHPRTHGPETGSRSLRTHVLFVQRFASHAKVDRGARWFGATFRGTYGGRRAHAEDVEEGATSFLRTRTFGVRERGLGTPEAVSRFQSGDPETVEAVRL